jgi:hypothetical protein
MESREALRMLAEVTESQWGMVTSAQALARGISHMNLTRLTGSGDLVRLAHGVYRDAGAPSTDHEELRAAWLATDPTRLAYERLGDHPPSAVISGESACTLHGIGDLRAMKSEFTTPTRRQTQRTDVRYRTRALPERDVALQDGLPVTTLERTIADLVEDRHDLSIVGHALHDAVWQARLDTDRLTELLNPLAERNGHRKGDGEALATQLLELAGVDLDSVAKPLAGVSGLAARVLASYLGNPPGIDVSALAPMVPAYSRLVDQAKAFNWAQLTQAMQPPKNGRAKPSPPKAPTRHPLRSRQPSLMLLAERLPKTLPSLSKSASAWSTFTGS